MKTPIHRSLVIPPSSFLLLAALALSGGTLAPGARAQTPSADNFNPGASGTPVPVAASLAVQADGKILVGGSFTTLAGQPRNNLGRLDSDGTLDMGFNPVVAPTDGLVVALSVQADGKILVGGWFTNLCGQPRDCIGRLNANGSVDAGFTAGVEAFGNPTASLALQADGKLLVGGDFNTLAGQPRACIGRLNATGPATQSLTSDGSTITWLRGGTSPEVWRTTFEHSPDDLDWTFLGAGTRISGGWRLTGLSLPPGGVIRARGFVAGSGWADWFVESVIGAPGIHLNLVRDGSEIILNWTGGQGPSQVQQTTNVNDLGSWEDVGASVPTNSMRLPLGPGNLFLRVRE